MFGYGLYGGEAVGDVYVWLEGYADGAGGQLGGGVRQECAGIGQMSGEAGQLRAAGGCAVKRRFYVLQDVFLHVECCAAADFEGCGQLGGGFLCSWVEAQQVGQ